MHTRISAVLIALGLVVAGAADAQVQTLTVTASGSTNYTINGVADPPLTVVRGTTYTFNVNAGGHPFWLKTVSSTGSANAYNVGVTNNGDDVGTITWTVASNAPNDLFYNCGTHAAMAGTITVLTPVPSFTGYGVALAALLGIVLGAWALRRRAARA